MWTFTLHYQGRFADREMEERPKVVGSALEVEVSRWESYYRLNIVNTDPLLCGAHSDES